MLTEITLSTEWRRGGGSVTGYTNFKNTIHFGGPGEEDDDIRIIYGTNRTGKTAMMNVINAVFPDYTEHRHLLVKDLLKGSRYSKNLESAPFKFTTINEYDPLLPKEILERAKSEKSLRDLLSPQTSFSDAHPARGFDPKYDIEFEQSELEMVPGLRNLPNVIPTAFYYEDEETLPPLSPIHKLMGKERTHDKDFPREILRIDRTGFRYRVTREVSFHERRFGPPPHKRNHHQPYAGLTFEVAHTSDLPGEKTILWSQETVGYGDSTYLIKDWDRALSVLWHSMAYTHPESVLDVPSFKTKQEMLDYLKKRKREEPEVFGGLKTSGSKAELQKRIVSIARADYEYSVAGIDRWIPEFESERKELQAVNWKINTEVALPGLTFEDTAALARGLTNFLVDVPENPTVKDLQLILKNLGLPSSGNKEALQNRLKEHTDSKVDRSRKDAILRILLPLMNRSTTFSFPCIENKKIGLYSLNGFEVIDRFEHNAVGLSGPVPHSMFAESWSQPPDRKDGGTDYLAYPIELWHPSLDWSTRSIMLGIDRVAVSERSDLSSHFDFKESADGLVSKLGDFWKDLPILTESETKLADSIVTLKELLESVISSLPEHGLKKFRMVTHDMQEGPYYGQPNPDPEAYSIDHFDLRLLEYLAWDEELWKNSFHAKGTQLVNLRLLMNLIENNESGGEIGRGRNDWFTHYLTESQLEAIEEIRWQIRSTEAAIKFISIAQELSGLRLLVPEGDIASCVTFERSVMEPEHWGDFVTSKYEQSIDDLSAGERHLFSILLPIATAILGDTERSDGATRIILVDEPEMSLHLDWQHELISRIEQVLNDTSSDFGIGHHPTKLILATHSVEIAAEHRQRLCRMGPKEQEYAP